MRILTEYLKKWNIPLSDTQVRQFKDYYDILIRQNEVMNLTAITESEEVQEKHFLDSLALSQVISLRGDESLIDIGTGAGFPGIPLKIVFPEMQIVLADALQKRVGFLNEVIGRLSLRGISAVHARAEDLGHDPAYRESFDLCVSRAVASLNLLSEYCLPLVKQGGLFAAYKSVNVREEADRAWHAITELGGGPAGIHELTLGPSNLPRTFVIIQKNGTTPEKYPRAKAKKKPL